jgi:hypothetical protein
LPATVGVRSRRGAHRYFRPPPGRAPLKVQLDPSGVVVSEDGYYVFAGGIHPTGHVYSLEDDAEQVYDLLVELGGRTRAETRRRFDDGGPIPEGHRDVAIFWKAVEILREGASLHDALARLLALNESLCRPPLPASWSKSSSTARSSSFAPSDGD